MIQKIADGFYFIERGWLNGNRFVFNGKNKVLIGTGYKKDLQHILYLVRQTGLEPQEMS